MIDFFKVVFNDGLEGFTMMRFDWKSLATDADFNW